MYFHPVKKSIGLIILYSAIIVGIFVLQFRSESVISKNFGALRVSLAQTQNKDGSTLLKNSVQVSFKGIAFTSDDVYPATLTRKVIGENNLETITSEKLIFESYEQTSPLSVTFKFNNNVSITFSASDNSENSTLTIFSSLPKDATSITLNFKPTSGYSVTDKTNTRQIFSSKNTMYSFSASKITDDEITLTARSPYGMFAIFDPSTVFTYANISADMPIALQSTYDACIREFKNQLIKQASESLKISSQLNETSVVAYVAEMMSQGKYTEALSSIPDSFKKGSKRTYLSAPYFGGLEAMYQSMKMKTENMKEMIELAANQKELNQTSLNIFTVEDIADYIYLFGATDNVKKMLSLPTSLIEHFSNKNDDEQNLGFTIAQATGIIRTYLKLIDYKLNLSEYLAPVIEKCLATIESNCNLSESALVINEKETPISQLLSLETGATLIKYGQLANSQDHVLSGYAIINTVLTSGIPDLMTLSEAYKTVINNKNYPHIVVLYRDKNIWTWTVANSVSYTERNNVGSLSVNSKVGDMHYQIINNLPNFKDINIYGLSYHSDPRFENYASSGYVYKSGMQTLFIKTRHKSDTEIVKFTF